jgi:hypothetical protein
MNTRFLFMSLVAAGIGLGGMVIAPATAHAHKDRDKGRTTYIYQAAPVCRDYSRTTFEYGALRVSYGTACQRNGGDWVVVKETYRPRYSSYNQPTRVIFVNDQRGRGGSHGGAHGWVRYDNDRGYNDRGRHDGRDRHHHR